MDEIFTMHILHEQPDENEKNKKNIDVDINEMDDDIKFVEFVEWDCFHELAQAYIYSQPLKEVFSPTQGLKHGTAFPNLFQPYMGRLVVPPCAKERL